MLRRIVQCGSLVAVIGGLGVVGAGCLDRPVVTANPQTKTNFSGLVAQNSVDQLDILFDIDNSASMGDKQALLELAIPDLIGRLVNPNCVDAMGVSSGPSVMGTCTATGTTAEFPAVHDMHLGIVSSSLGTRGGDLCYPTQMTNNAAAFLDGMPSIPSHTDDQGHLLNRTATNAEAEGTSADVGGQSFLDWFPPSSDTNDPTAAVGNQALTPPATALTDAMTLETDFSNLVAGVHAYGCGIESQLESWYRFLIQPDPYQSIAGPPKAAGDPAQGSWVGYDQTIIQQRHDFLRPTSLVAVIVLSDENDSEIDTRSFGGAAVNWMVNGAPTTNPDGTMTPAFNPPKGTQICQTSPADPGCTSCAYKNNPNDPNCMTNSTYTSPVDWGNDANLRHVHMKQKYGLDRLQYPIQRYYLGLTSPTVPDRTMEYPPGAQFYAGGTAQEGAPGDSTQLNCTNPLFAPPNADGSTSLPDGSLMTAAALCNLAHPAVAGRSRGAGLVFFAHIGGVPHQLLQAAPGDTDPATKATLCATGTAPADCPQKDTLLPADWVKILGNGAATATPTSAPSYDYTGIDPHMIESYQPRTAASGVLPAGVAALTANAAAAGGGFAEGDPINGNEWVTDTSSTDTTGNILPQHTDLPVDREYACIFPLVNPTTGAATPRDCSNPMDFVNQEACDCSPPNPATPPLAGTAPTPVPAVCGQCTAACSAGASSNYNLQYFAKTYPTIREIELVHLMGSQGILSSMCPIHPSYVGGTTDPVFGYRPAVNSIINRLKTALEAQCTPQPLSPQQGQCTGPGSNPAQECVQCLILVTLAATDPHTCTDYATQAMPLPFSDPSPQVEANFLSQQQDGGLTGRLCQVAQIPYQKGVSCETGAQLGWCYADGAASGEGCVAKNTPQAIVFAKNTLPHGSVVSLQCLETSAAPNADGGGD